MGIQFTRALVSGLGNMVTVSGILCFIYIRCLGSGPWTQDTVLPGNCSLDFGYCTAWELVPGLLDMYYGYQWIMYAQCLMGITLIVIGITLHC